MSSTRRVWVCSAALSLAAFFGVNLGTANAATEESLFTAQTPALTNVSDGSNVNYELGMKFTSGVAGQIAGIRFWKSSKESGTHTGHIWSASGQLLATLTFTNETGSGWQAQMFASPIAVKASTVYVVSVNTGRTYYAATNRGLASQVVNQDLRSVVGSNDVFGAPGSFPTSTFKSSNYFRDVIFTPGTAALTQQLSASASSLSFGNVNVGSSASQTLTMTNSGTGSVSISQMTAAGTGYTSVSGVTLPMSLAAGQTVSTKVTFAPTAMGSNSGSVSVVSSATNSPSTVALSGSGTAGTQPMISVVPVSVGFGSVSVGLSNTQTVTISNPGNASLSVTQSLLAGTGMSMSGLSLPLTVLAGKSASFTVAFAPKAAGSITGSLTLVSNAPNSPLAVAVTGTGVTSVLQLSVTPGSLSFGSLAVGSNATQIVTIANSGNSSVSVSALTKSGAAFSMNGISLPVTLAAAQSATFNVVFTPASAGSAVGSIAVVSTATTAPAPISLSGTGTAAATHTAALNWAASTSTVAGYNVYRGTQTGGPYAIVDSSLVTIMNYTDSAVTSGHTYYYVVTAVDASGNESINSNEAAAIIP
jgi:hypothetical protein